MTKISSPPPDNGVALSLILCSRNDEYMGNSRWRLRTTLNAIGETVQSLGLASRVEVIVADWGSEQPLRDTVVLEPSAAAIVSFLTVPPAIARDRQADSPFPEVLALNAAARRARGRYIGRIDQDTIVGARFLRRFFNWVDGRETPPEPLDRALWFANRRGVPFRLVSRSPARRHVSRFVRMAGPWLPVWRYNNWFNDEFWSSFVGLWLVHRTLWVECGGYDERMIYYNWMETDMIRRLRQKYPIVDLGRLVEYDFFHLEHFHPRLAETAPRHGRKNPDINASSPVPAVHPNGPQWGLADCDLALDRSRAPRDAAAASPAWWRDTAAFGALVTRLCVDACADWAANAWTSRYAVARRRMHQAQQGIAGQPIREWPGTLWKLWQGRKVDRAL